MNLTSLEVSKKLKEAGVDLETEFYWNQWPNKKWQIDYVEYEVGILPDRPLIKAYDFETLLQIVPKNLAPIGSLKILFNSAITKQIGEKDEEWIGMHNLIGYFNQSDYYNGEFNEKDSIFDGIQHCSGKDKYHIENDNLANATARLLLKILTMDKGFGVVLVTRLDNLT